MKKIIRKFFGHKTKTKTWLSTKPTCTIVGEHKLSENAWYKKYKVSSLWVDDTPLQNAKNIMKMIHDDSVNKEF